MANNVERLETIRAWIANCDRDSKELVLEDLDHVINQMRDGGRE